jgi:hypothetical protein
MSPSRLIGFSEDIANRGVVSEAWSDPGFGCVGVAAPPEAPVEASLVLLSDMADRLRKG